MRRGPGRRGHREWEEGELYLPNRDHPEDLPAVIARHRRALAADPNSLGTRFMLANCLYVGGDHAQAQAEWQTVVLAGGFWAETVAEAMRNLGQMQDEGAA